MRMLPGSPPFSPQMSSLIFLLVLRLRSTVIFIRPPTPSPSSSWNGSLEGRRRLQPQERAEFRLDLSERAGWALREESNRAALPIDGLDLIDQDDARFRQPLRKGHFERIAFDLRSNRANYTKIGPRIVQRLG